MAPQQSGSWPSPGPLETAQFPEQITARVVTPGGQPRIHGYDVESDLAQHYSPSEVAFLAITGELPSAEIAAALDAILVFASPVSVALAPTHAAVLAQLCGSGPSAVVSVAAIALTEQVRFMLKEHEPFLSWLATAVGEIPDQFRTTEQGEMDSVQRFNRALRKAGIEVSVLSQNPTPSAAILAGLRACGLRSFRQYEALLVWARLPIVIAEAFSEHVTNFRHYPINLPHYTYEE